MRKPHFKEILRDYPPEDRLVRENLLGEVTFQDQEGFIVYRKSREEFLQDLMGILNIRWREGDGDRNKT